MTEETATTESMEETYSGQTDVWARETAPQTRYTMRQVGIGLVVLAIGAVVAFGVPLTLA